MSLAPEILNRRLSSFEVLEACAVTGACGSTDASTAVGSSASDRSGGFGEGNAQALQARFKQAYERRIPVRDLLAIR